METLQDGELASYFTGLSCDSAKVVLKHENSEAFEKMEVDASQSSAAGVGRPLIPVIFSHGLSSNRTMHSGTCRDLASHGYIVFALDHMDLTSSYYETPDG